MYVIAYNVELHERCGYLTFSDVTQTTHRRLNFVKSKSAFQWQGSLYLKSHTWEKLIQLFFNSSMLITEWQLPLLGVSHSPSVWSQNWRVLICFDRITCTAYGPVAVFLYATQWQTMQKWKENVEDLQIYLWFVFRASSNFKMLPETRWAAFKQ
jgi:hypothetical protein